jgi:uncharacterized protein (TIGR00369 family)
VTEEESTRLKEFMEQRIPFNAFLGMKVTMMGDGEAEMMIPVRPELTGDPFRPALHGGVLSTIADTVGGLAVFTQIGNTRIASTVDLRIDYLRPGQVDQPILARARVIRIGNRVAATQTVVYQRDIDKPIATANAVYNVVTRDQTPQSPLNE